MSGFPLVLHQFRFDQKVFWRNPASVFFTALLPLLFLFIFASFFKNANIPGSDVKGATYYVPAIVALSVISATTVKLAMNLSAEREAGQLKRVRGTPLPPAAFVAGRVGNSLVISVIMVVLVSVIGALFYGVTIPTDTLPALLVTLAVGSFFVLLPWVCPRGGHPHARTQPRPSPMRSSSLSTSSPGSSSPRTRSRTGSSISPPSSRSGPFSRRCSPPGTRTRRLGLRAREPRGGLRLGAFRARRRGPLLSLGATTLTRSGASHV